MIRQPGAPRPSRRSSAIGLLNGDDDNAYGSNAQRYNEDKMKGSFVNRFKQNMGQKMEAFQDSLEEMPSKAQSSMRALKISAPSPFVTPASEENNKNNDTSNSLHQGDGNWASMEDSSPSLDFAGAGGAGGAGGAAEEEEGDYDMSNFDAFDFENGFDNGFGQDDDDGSVINNPLNEGPMKKPSSNPFNVTTGSSRNLGFHSRRPEGGSKARAQSRDSNLSSDGSGTQPPSNNDDDNHENVDNLEDGVEDGEDKPFLQFSPEDSVARKTPEESEDGETPSRTTRKTAAEETADGEKKEKFATVMGAVAATNSKNGNRSAFSSSAAHQIDIPSHMGQDSKGTRRGTGAPRTRRSDPGAEGTAIKSNRRSQRRSGRRRSVDAKEESSDGVAIEKNSISNSNEPVRRVRSIDPSTRRSRGSQSNGRRISKEIYEDTNNGLAESTTAVEEPGPQRKSVPRKSKPRRGSLGESNGRRVSKEIYEDPSKGADMNGVAESTTTGDEPGPQRKSVPRKSKPRRGSLGESNNRRVSKEIYEAADMNGLAESTTGDEPGPPRKSGPRTSKPRRGSLGDDSGPQQRKSTPRASAKTRRGSLGDESSPQRKAGTRTSAKPRRGSLGDDSGPQRKPRRGSLGDESGSERNAVPRPSGNPRRVSRKPKDEKGKRSPNPTFPRSSYHGPGPRGLTRRSSADPGDPSHTRGLTRRSSADPGDPSHARAAHGTRPARRSSAGKGELTETKHLKLVF